jgi:hypothetical protein
MTYTPYRPTLITCAEPGCEHSFFYVAARNYPRLCLDHAQRMERSYEALKPSDQPLVTLVKPLAEGSYGAYLAAVNLELIGNTEWSVPETYWNILCDLRPEIGEALSGTIYDPYDVRPPLFNLAYFLDLVERIWSK